MSGTSLVQTWMLLCLHTVFMTQKRGLMALFFPASFSAVTSVRMSNQNREQAANHRSKPSVYAPAELNGSGLFLKLKPHTISFLLQTHLLVAAYVVSLSVRCLFQTACSTSTRQEPLGCLKPLLLCTAGRKEPCS